MEAGNEGVEGVDVAYALSPEAKGKVGRPYRWLQDRIVMTCAIERLTDIGEVCAVLKDEVSCYKNHRVHSTTGEVLSAPFENDGFNPAKSDVDDELH